MKFKQLRKKLKQAKKDLWNSDQPKFNEPKIKLTCEKCEKLNLNFDEETGFPLMMPHELPNDKDLKLFLKQHYKFIPSLNLFKRSYIFFVCPKCGWRKFTKLQNIIEEKYIDVDICKDCKHDVCSWINCTNGGYIKNKMMEFDF